MEEKSHPIKGYLSNVPRIPFYLSNIVAIYTILQKQYKHEAQKIPRPTSGGIPRSSFTSSEAGYKIVAYANVHSVVSEVVSADSTPQDFHAAEAQAREILVYSILINESCCEAVGMGSGNVKSGGGGVGGAIESLERGMRGLMMGGSLGLEDDNGLGLLSSSPASNSSKGSSSSSKMMRMKEGILEDVGYFLSTVIGILRSYTDDIRHPSVMRLQDEVSYYLQSLGVSGEPVNNRKVNSGSFDPVQSEGFAGNNRNTTSFSKSRINFWRESHPSNVTNILLPENTPAFPEDISLNVEDIKNQVSPSSGTNRLRFFSETMPVSEENSYDPLKPRPNSLQLDAYGNSASAYNTSNKNSRSSVRFSFDKNQSNRFSSDNTSNFPDYAKQSQQYEDNSYTTFAALQKQQAPIPQQHINQPPLNRHSYPMQTPSKAMEQFQRQQQHHSLRLPITPSQNITPYSSQQSSHSYHNSQPFNVTHHQTQQIGRIYPPGQAQAPMNPINTSPSQSPSGFTNSPRYSPPISPGTPPMSQPSFSSYGNTNNFAVPTNNYTAPTNNYTTPSNRQSARFSMRIPSSSSATFAPNQGNFESTNSSQVTPPPPPMNNFPPPAPPIATHYGKNPSSNFSPHTPSISNQHGGKIPPPPRSVSPPMQLKPSQQQQQQQQQQQLPVVPSPPPPPPPRKVGSVDSSPRNSGSMETFLKQSTNINSPSTNNATSVSEIIAQEQDAKNMSTTTPAPVNIITYINPLIDPQGFEKLPPVTRFLAHIRRQSMDVIFPQHLHDECMTCIYAAFKFHQVPVVHRVLMHTVSVLKESGLFYEGLKSLSKTKIRGVLSILKKAQIVMDYSGASSDMARIQLSSEIDGYGRMHEWHDQLLLSYCQENHLYIPDDCMQEIVWRLTKDSTAADQEEGTKIEKYESMAKKMVEHLFEMKHFNAAKSIAGEGLGDDDGDNDEEE